VVSPDHREDPPRACHASLVYARSPGIDDDAEAARTLIGQVVDDRVSAALRTGRMNITPAPTSHCSVTKAIVATSTTQTSILNVQVLSKKPERWRATNSGATCQRHPSPHRTPVIEPPSFPSSAT
jgi:hypothetical protein